MTVTKTIGPSGRDYSNLTDYEAYLQTQDPIADTYAAVFDGEITQSSSVTFDDYGQTASSRLTFAPASGEGFADNADPDGSDALDYDASLGAAISATASILFNGDYIDVTGLQFFFSDRTSDYIRFYGYQQSIQRNIFRFRRYDSPRLHLQTNDIDFINNLVFATDQSSYDFSRVIELFNDNAGNPNRLVNNTFCLADGGSSSTSAVFAADYDATNCHFAQNLVIGFNSNKKGVKFNETGQTGDYNLTSHATNTNLPGGNSEEDAGVDEFIGALDQGSSAAYDFRLSPYAKAVQFIPQASKDAYSPSVDIYGRARPGDVDAGCFQLSSLSFAGDADITIPMLTASGAGTFAANSYAGDADITLPMFTVAGAGTAVVPEFTGDADVYVPMLEVAGTGTKGTVSYAGAADITIPMLTVSGEGAFAELNFTGDADISIPMLTVSAEGRLGEPYESAGTSAIELPMLTVFGRAHQSDASRLAQAVFREVSRDVFLVLLTITHDELADPIRVVNNNENITSRGDVYTAFPFNIQLPDQNEQGLVVARVTIDNISRDLVDLIRSFSEPPVIQIEVVHAPHVDSPGWDIVDLSLVPLQLVNVEYDATTITGDLALENLVRESFPGGRFDPARWPGLF